MVLKEAEQAALTGKGAVSTIKVQQQDIAPMKRFMDRLGPGTRQTYGDYQ